MGWIETLGELSQIVCAQILVCDSELLQKGGVEVLAHILDTCHDTTSISKWDQV